MTDLGGDNRDPDEIFNRIMEEVDTETSLVAIGNVRGQGERLLEYLQALGERG